MRLEEPKPGNRPRYMLNLKLNIMNPEQNQAIDNTYEALAKIAQIARLLKEVKSVMSEKITYQMIADVSIAYAEKHC